MQVKKMGVVWGLILFFLFTLSWTAQAAVPPAPSTHIYVQDYAHVLSSQTKQEIMELSSALESRSKAQIVVVTVDTLDQMPVEDYALKILRQWKVGDKEKNNGVVLLVAVKDRKSRIEVGYGLEGALPDGKTGEIQDEYMIPYFREGKYDMGISNGYKALVQVVAKEYNLNMEQVVNKKIQAIPVQQHEQGDAMPWWLRVLLGIGLVLLLIVDWMFFGGIITLSLLSIISRSRGGGGGRSGGFGGGSGGGGGSSRGW